MGILDTMKRYELGEIYPEYILGKRYVGVWEIGCCVRPSSDKQVVCRRVALRMMESGSALGYVFSRLGRCVCVLDRIIVDGEYRIRVVERERGYKKLKTMVWVFPDVRKAVSVE